MEQEGADGLFKVEQAAETHSPDPYLAPHHDNTVGVEEAAGVSLIQAQSRFHGEPGTSPKIFFH